MNPLSPVASKKISKLSTYFLFCEGEITESDYFTLVIAPKISGHISLKVNPDLKSLRKGTDVQSLINWAQAYFHSHGPAALGDEIWIIADMDENTIAQLQSGVGWAKTSTQPQYLAISTPCFEFWLLCHFENIYILQNARIKENVSYQLKQYNCMRGTDNKYIEASKFTLSAINTAIDNARNLIRSSTINCPKPCGSTVYRLMEKFFP